MESELLVTKLRREGHSVVGATESCYFLGNYYGAQFNELVQLDSQSISYHYPVETISSPMRVL